MHLTMSFNSQPDRLAQDNWVINFIHPAQLNKPTHNPTQPTSITEHDIRPIRTQTNTYVDDLVQVKRPNKLSATHVATNTRNLLEWMLNIWCHTDRHEQYWYDWPNAVASSSWWRVDIYPTAFSTYVRGNLYCAVVYIVLQQYWYCVRPGTWYA